MKNRLFANTSWYVALIALIAGPAALARDPGPQVAEGEYTLLDGLLRDYSYLLTDDTRAALDEINRQLREADEAIKKAADDEARAEATKQRDASKAKLFDALEALPIVHRLSFEGPPRAELITAKTPGDMGALLFRVEAGTGDATTQCGTVHYDLTAHRENVLFHPLPFAVPDDGVLWLLLGMKSLPIGRTSFYVSFTNGPDARVLQPVDVITPQPGRFHITILSDDTGRPVPAMVQLIWKGDGIDRRPSNAIEFGPQFESQGNASGRRGVFGPGKMNGYFWCVPGPFDMDGPPGEWEITIRRGVEHIPIRETFTVESGGVVNKTFRPRRWIDMRKRGWYSGDDHVHTRIMSDDDARNVIHWIEAADISLANIVKMGDIIRTYFEQRGFGPMFRVREGWHILSPGQECPRTHQQLGHTIQMNTTSMVRDTDKYYLYDTVFDEVHRQGGLSGYAHVQVGMFEVRRDMSLNIPKGKVDFAEVLQFNTLGTDLWYEFLNLGYKVTASSGSDVPWGGTVGDTRVYAYLGDEPFTADTWFKAFGEGHTFVTNGPMIDFHVDDALPGDQIDVTENRTLKVTATVVGDFDRFVPTKLEIVRLSDLVASADNPDLKKKELTLTVDVPAGYGGWIAARAEGNDGSRAHTTPVYVVRKGFRPWKLDDVDELIAKREACLDEIEQIVADAKKQVASGEAAGNRVITELAEQGDALLERVAAARKIYAELKQTAASERDKRK